MFDYLIVGAGFAGSVLAERLAGGAGKSVLLIDSRDHVAGNAYDYYDAAGVLVHKYGPHIFHTNSDDVFQYLSRFTSWRPYEHRVLSSVDGQLVPIPINLTTLEALYGRTFTPKLAEQFFAEHAEPVASIRTSEDIVVSRVGRELYEKFFRGYTRKQWGLDPSQLDSTVAGRVPARIDRDDRYFTDVHQAMPAGGYTEMFKAMLCHKNIRLELGLDYQTASLPSYKRLIYTGPIDAFFGHRFGKLPYRSINFQFETRPSCGFLQPVGTVNFPNDYSYTRTTEFKHLTGQHHAQTTLCFEFPTDGGDPYYPVPRRENLVLYEKYRALASSQTDTFFTGRLGTYRYYNMDQVVAQSLALYRTLEPPA